MASVCFSVKISHLFVVRLQKKSYSFVTSKIKILLACKKYIISNQKIRECSSHSVVIMGAEWPPLQSESLHFLVRRKLFNCLIKFIISLGSGLFLDLHDEKVVPPKRGVDTDFCCSRLQFCPSGTKKVNPLPPFFLGLEEGISIDNRPPSPLSLCFAKL